MNTFDTRLSTFAKCWALASLFHQAKPAHWVSGTPEAALTFASFLLLFVRVTVFRFALFLVLQICVIMSQLPWPVTNHWILTFFIGFSGLIAAAQAIRKDGSWAPTARTWLGEFVDPARIQVLVLYAFTFLHKLNSDFLDVSHSCASAHYLNLKHLIPFLPGSEWARLVAVYSTLAIEGGIPLLLFFGRTRLIGVGLALGFHTLIGLNNFFDFSATMFALLLLFIPAGPRGPKAPTWAYDFAWGPARLEASRPVAFLVSASALAGILTVLAGRLSKEASTTLGIVCGVVYGGGLLLSFLMFLKARRSLSADSDSIRFGALPHFVPLLLLILNGLSPYLGLKTESSFAMFSNLRTEGGKSNHLFMPSAQLFGFQEELVQIVDSTDPELKNKHDQWIPISGLRLRFEESLRRGSPFSVSYRSVDGTLRSLGGAPDSASQGLTPYLLWKVLVFRSIKSPDRMICQH